MFFIFYIEYIFYRKYNTKNRPCQNRFLDKKFGSFDTKNLGAYFIMENFVQKYETDILVLKPRINEDIYEHLETLRKYASECESVIECGVRKCNSPWALVYGLMENGKDKKHLLLNDIQPTNSVDELYEYSKDLPVTIECKWGNDLDLDIDTQYDMVFIDTWHVYGQLKRELNKFAPLTSKYIVMHDTVVDGILGESIRCKMDSKQQSLDFNIPEEEILKGLMPAIIEFLSENSDKWILDMHFKNNNGLTIIRRL